MAAEMIREKIKDYARDTRINLGKVLTEDGSQGLNLSQIWGVALTSAYTTGHVEFFMALTEEAKEYIGEAEIDAAKSAASVMAMNNVYYRSCHFLEDPEYSSLPAGLRMSVIGRPGIDKIDFELYSLAASAISGCGKCLVAHERQVVSGGISKQGVHSTIKIAAVINAAAKSLTIG